MNWRSPVTLNINRAYKAKLSKASGVPVDQVDFWFGRVISRSGNHLDLVKDAPVIARAMRQMFRANKRKSITCGIGDV